MAAEFILIFARLSVPFFKAGPPNPSVQRREGSLADSVALGNCSVTIPPPDDHPRLPLRISH